MSKFADRLNDLIKSRGVTQKYLASKSGVTSATISRYTCSISEPVVFDMIVKLARALNVTTDYLLGASNLESQSLNVPNDVKLLLDAYDKLTPDDRAVLWSLLLKYLAPADYDDIPCTIVTK